MNKNTTTTKHKEKGCVVCGARLDPVTNPYLNTCSGTCSRAHAVGRTRGQQMEHEVRVAANQRLEGVPQASVLGYTGLGYRVENDYNQPYLFAKVA